MIRLKISNFKGFKVKVFFFCLFFSNFFDTHNERSTPDPQPLSYWFNLYYKQSMGSVKAHNMAIYLEHKHFSFDSFLFTELFQHTFAIYVSYTEKKHTICEWKKIGWFICFSSRLWRYMEKTTTEKITVDCVNATISLSVTSSFSSLSLCFFNHLLKESFSSVQFVH